jgi:hypothetical protein
MSAHDSDAPEGGKKRHVRVDGSGMSMSWRNIAIFVGTIIFGGGSYTGIKLVTKDEMNTAINARVGDVEKVVRVNQTEIVGITATIGLVDKRQIRQIASEEAREDTADIENREKREREYQRLYESKVDKLTAESTRVTARAKRSRRGDLDR